MNAFLRNQTEIRNLRAFVAVVLALLALAMAGCAKPGADPVANGNGTAGKNEPEPAATPEELLYEQLRSGMFQMGAAAGSIEEALAAARDQSSKVPKVEREAFLEVADLADSAGAEVSEFAGDPPPKEEVLKGFALFDERRLRAVEAGNDAMHDLREAAGIMADLEESRNAQVAAAAREVRSLLLVALDDLWGAIEAFGGKPEIEEPIAP